MPEGNPIAAGDDGVYIRVHVQPGASRPRVIARVIDRHGDARKVAVAAPPVDGRANEAVVEAIAKVFGVPARDVSLISGQSARRKRFFVRGIDERAAQRKLDAALTDRS